MAIRREDGRRTETGEEGEKSRGGQRRGGGGEGDVTILVMSLPADIPQILLTIVSIAFGRHKLQFTCSSFDIFLRQKTHLF